MFTQVHRTIISYVQYIWSLHAGWALCLSTLLKRRVNHEDQAKTAFLNWCNVIIFKREKCWALKATELFMRKINLQHVKYISRFFNFVIESALFVTTNLSD